MNARRERSVATLITPLLASITVNRHQRSRAGAIIRTIARSIRGNSGLSSEGEAAIFLLSFPFLFCYQFQLPATSRNRPPAIDDRDSAWIARFFHSLRTRSQDFPLFSAVTANQRVLFLYH